MRSIVASICLLFGVAIALPVIADAGSGSGSAVVAATAPGSGAAIGSAISPAAPGSGSAVGSAAGSGSAAAPAPAVAPSIDENPAGFVQAAYRAATGTKREVGHYPHTCCALSDHPPCADSIPERRQ